VKLLGTTIRNMGPFDSIELDLSQLSPEQKIIAITGDNGAGKSTLLEAMTGAALYREFATHGSLGAMSCARDAMMLTGIKHAGQAWSLKHLVDGREGESVFANSTGTPINNDAKKTSFDAAVQRYMPPEKLLYATVWRAQGEKGLLEAKDRDRQELILMATGATKYASLAETCRGKANEYKARCSELRGDITSLEKLQSVSSCESTLVAAKATLENCTADVELARVNLEIARAAASDTAVARAEYQRAINERRNLYQNQLIATRSRETTANQLAVARGITDQAQEIRNAIADCTRLEQRIGELKQELSAAEVKRSEVLATGKAYRSKLEDTQKQIAEMERVLADTNDVSAAVLQLPKVEQQIKDIESTLAIARSELEQLQATRVADKDTRIDQLRCGLIEIRDIGESIPEMTDDEGFDCTEFFIIAKNTLTADDQIAHDAIEVPGRIDSLTAQIAELSQQLTDAGRKRSKALSLAARAPEVERARETIERARKSAAQQQEYLDALSVEVKNHTDEISRLTLSIDTVADELKATRKLAQQSDALSRAEALVDTLGPRITELDATIASLQTQLDSLMVPDAPESPADVAALERVLTDLVGLERAATSNVAILGERLESARARVVELEQLRAQLEAAELEQSDWFRLANDLGRDGLQAALVDAAGPELTDTVNHLLHTHYGSRFTVRVSTQRQSADKKKTIEECEIMVYDAGDATHNPTEHEGRTYSGGEKGIIDEAVSLGLTYLARNAGIIDPDLVRDESGQNMAAHNRVKWIDMLRGASEMIGCQHVYIISHFEDVIALADARIEVANRTARIT